MPKFVRSLTLLSALAVFAAGTGSMAQDKKADPKKPADTKKPAADDKKPADTKKPDEKESATVEVYKNDKGRWRFRVRNAEGKLLAMPHTTLNWETKAEAEKAVAELKTILTTVKVTEAKE